MSIVVAAFVIAIFIVPVRANVAIVDDWVYIKEAQGFADHLRVHILPQTGANAVFETFWGGLFGIVLGTQLWVFRLSTVVLSLAGGLGMYGVGRQLGATKSLSAAGAGLFLFNPLYFVLTYTFMTDAHFVALSVLATYGYLRGLDEANARHARWTITASALAALAYLSRPQGALIPIGVVLTLALARRLRFNRAGAVRVLHVAFVPFTVFLIHQWWLRHVNGVPSAQTAFTHAVVSMPLSEAASLVVRISTVQGAYVGLFLLPVAAALIVSLRSIVRSVRWQGWLLLGAGALVMTVGVVHFARRGRQMPYVASSPGMGQWGLGTDSVVGSRPALFQHWFFDLLTVVSLIGLAVIVLALAQAAFDRSLTHRLAAGLCGSLVVMMALGAIPPSATISPLTTFDRYLVPMIPFVIAVGIWAARGLRQPRFVLPAGVVAMTVISVIGTRDSLVFEQAVWKMADHANSLGVANTQLDAGASRTRYYLANQAPRVPLARGASQPWWVWTDGATTAEYVISATPLDGYDVIDSAPLSQWIAAHPIRMYLLHLRPPAG